jgi:hypothetical protein
MQRGRGWAAVRRAWSRFFRAAVAVIRRRAGVERVAAKQIDPVQRGRGCPDAARRRRRQQKDKEGLAPWHVIFHLTNPDKNRA